MSIAHQTRPLASLKANPRNARTHSRKQTAQIAASIAEFGFINPILVDEEGMLIAGHGRLEAARELNLPDVPVIVVGGLSDLQKRRLMLADNKLAENSGWDREKLSIELHEIEIAGGDITITGFGAPEIDQLSHDFANPSADPADACPDPHTVAVSRTGDIWVLNKHRLLCGDARSRDQLDQLMAGELAAMAFEDVPYNVRVAGLVGRGKVSHAEFAMASGEMSEDEFRRFLTEALSAAAAVSRPGSVHYCCIDWRHVETMIAAGRDCYAELLNLVVWIKTNGGQGAFYRSRHELIAVFRVGPEAHQNNVELGKHGRNRTNVWEYPGINAFGRDRLKDLASHPTVKPVALVADAMLDCTGRGDIVLDSFGGSGTTLLAAEKVGRRGYLMEIEPRFVDLTIRRWQDFTRSDAVHAETGQTFDERSAQTEVA